MQSHILTVTQLTRQIRDLLEGTFSEIWVEGEISNLTAPQSGHIYFTLKDEQAQIRAVLFRSSQRHLKFTLQHGMRVICRGRVSVYEPRGEYQVIVEYIEPKGVGALQKAFEELKARLEREGLFNLDRKRPLPVLPSRIGIVTSPTGAAIRDILRVMRRRHPRMGVLVYPVPVQGPAAAPAIAEAIGYFNREKCVDVMIVGRGGGSLEDLWAFNEEAVARAIYASRIPVISAVGHETDYSIADFVADLRAPTPSAAAEMVVESEEHLRSAVHGLLSRLTAAVRSEMEQVRIRLDHAIRLLGDPRKRTQEYGQRIDELQARLAYGLRNVLRQGRTRLGSMTAALDHLNPLGILSRGYSVTRREPAGTIIKNAGDVLPGDRIRTQVFKGVIVSHVEERKE